MNYLIKGCGHANFNEIRDHINGKSAAELLLNASKGMINKVTIAQEGVSIYGVKIIGLKAQEMQAIGGLITHYKKLVSQNSAIYRKPDQAAFLTYISKECKKNIDDIKVEEKYRPKTMLDAALNNASHKDSYFKPLWIGTAGMLSYCGISSLTPEGKRAVYNNRIEAHDMDVNQGNLFRPSMGVVDYAIRPLIQRSL